MPLPWLARRLSRTTHAQAKNLRRAGAECVRVPRYRAAAVWQVEVFSVCCWNMWLHPDCSRRRLPAGNMLARSASLAATQRCGNSSFFRLKPSGDVSMDRGDYDFARATIQKALKLACGQQFVASRVAAREQLPGGLRLDDERLCFAGPGAIDRHCFDAPRSASNVDLRPQIHKSQITCCYLSFVSYSSGFDFSTISDRTAVRALRTVSREKP